jgi:Xaa-Pro aminopeptidase
MWFHGTRYAVIVTAEGHVSFLVASGDYLRVTRTMPWLMDITPFPFVMLEGVPLITSTLKRLDLDQSRIGIDLLPVGVFLKLQEVLPKARFVDGMPALEEARLIKHPLEVEMLRGAAQLADLGMQAALEMIKEGITELEISAAAAAEMMRAGSEDITYYPLVISGANLWLKYRFPTAKRLWQGETVWIDCGACIYNGYNGDIARIVVVGRHPTQEQRRIYRTIYDMLQTAIRWARPGVEIEQLNGEVMEVVRKAGYEQYCPPTILGHGVGTDLHEAPAIGEKVKANGNNNHIKHLEPNMVLAFEPGIIVPGVGGGHLEDMVLVTEEGPEVLTRTPFDEALL